MMILHRTMSVVASWVIFLVCFWLRSSDVDHLVVCKRLADIEVNDKYHSAFDGAFDILFRFCWRDLCIMSVESQGTWSPVNLMELASVSFSSIIWCKRFSLKKRFNDSTFVYSGHSFSCVTICMTFTIWTGAIIVAFYVLGFLHDCLHICLKQNIFS